MCPQKAEHHLNKLQRRALATAISSDTRDGNETQTLLLQPPRILCANTGHYPHSPWGACAACHCQGPVIQGQIPQENTRCASGCCNAMLASAAAGSPHIPIITNIPFPPPGLNEPESPVSRCFNPSCLGRNRCLRSTYTQRWGQIQS